MSSHTQIKKREPSPSLSHITPQKKSRIDTLFDSPVRDEDSTVAELAVAEEFHSFFGQSPLFEDRHSSHFEPGSGYDRTPTREFNPKKRASLHSILDDPNEEEDLFCQSNLNPYRRSLYSELILSSNLDEDDYPHRKHNASSLFQDDEEDNFESKTTLPLSKSYVRPIPEDEIDAFFSNHDGGDEPEFVLHSALKYSLLQQNRQGPAWITNVPHFLTPDYFKSHQMEDRSIEVESKTTTIATHFESKFTMLGRLGSGEFAEVWKVKCLETDRLFAVKKTKVSFTGWEDRWLKIIEVDHLNKVKDSQHCLHLINAWEEKAYLYIQLELCSNGSLYDYIKYKNGKISQDIVWKIFYELVLGVKDIHDANIVHLDLKPSNILIDELGSIKIGDFGISVETPVDIKYLKGEGDRRYMAPDLLREDFEKPADIYSLGLILLELATGITLPGTGESWEMLRIGDFSRQKLVLSKLSSELSEMIKWLLTTESKDRPTANDIIQHSTLKQFKTIKQDTLTNYVHELSQVNHQLKLQSSNTNFTASEQVF